MPEVSQNLPCPERVDARKPPDCLNRPRCALGRFVRSHEEPAHARVLVVRPSLAGSPPGTRSRTLIVNIVDAWLCALANPTATLTPLGRQAIMAPPISARRQKPDGEITMVTRTEVVNFGRVDPSRRR